MTKINIKKRDSAPILNALSGGVVPNRGLQHIMVGRTEEAQQIVKDLTNISQGSSIVKFYIGPFGSGKSFIQAFIKQLAFKTKGKAFVVANADFTPERRLYATDGKSVATYSELMKNLAIPTQPDGNALPTLLDKWIQDIQLKVIEEKGYDTVSYDNPKFKSDVALKINQVVTQMDTQTGGFDFARILTLYFQSVIEDNQDLQRCTLRWLKGEYGTRTEAKADLGVREVIDDQNWYNFIKIWSQFVKQAGYAGLIINFDEAINLYKITHAQSREKNYETILKIFNDLTQGVLEGLYITFGGTPEFLEDERRGLFSYGALKSRLVTNKFETDQFRDLTQPVIKLKPLDLTETYHLLTKIRNIHETHYGYEPIIQDEEIKHFIQQEYSRPGAAQNLTVRDMIKSFISALNILEQNPDFDHTEIFGQVAEEIQQDIMSRFSQAEA